MFIVNRRPSSRVVASLAAAAICAAWGADAAAEPLTYALDPMHTYPSFEADHFGGVSIFRGKFKRSKGSVTIDREAKTGSLEATIDLSSIDSGLDALDGDLRSANFFEVARFPTAVYQGTLRFEGDVPVEVVGTLTLHGVTRPVNLKIESFRCFQSGMLKRQVCGTESTAAFDRSDFGMSAGKDYGFRMRTVLHIQAEGILQQAY
jgi:polyisoprenoid-binding protein YceI